MTAKLAGINLLMTAALLCVVGLAWSRLPDGSDSGEAAVLGRAQRLTQHIDMLHDTLRADVLAALLVSRQGVGDRDAVQRSARDSALAFRSDMVALRALTVREPIRPQLESAHVAAADYVEAAERMVTLALSDPSQALAARARFDEVFETARVALEAQTTAIASSLDAANERTRSASVDARRWLLAAALVTVAIGWFAVASIGRSIRRSLTRLRDVAQALAAGDLERRSDHSGHDEVGQLATAVNGMADALQSMIGRMRADAQQAEFGTRLVAALDMADNEAQTHAIVERSMALIDPDRPMELLLADSSEAHLERAAQHPSVGPPGCGVDSPFACAAVRRGRAMHFPDSEAFDACPLMRGRTVGAISASCVPVSFSGRALGVLHVAGPVDELLAKSALERLATLGAHIGGRIGTVRAFERTQVQATTDGLTGLSNRRAAETRMRDLTARRQPFSFVMADLDHFKLLNDTHGHQVGDEALRAFADVARDGMRSEDLASRWGGEEFAFVLVGADAHHAKEWCERLRDRLVHTLRHRSAPAFTASFGVCEAADDLPISSMIASADMALYRAKASGRDRSILSTPDDVVRPPLPRLLDHDTAKDPSRSSALGPAG